jgi:hypothetical protein
VTDGKLIGQSCIHGGAGISEMAWPNSQCAEGKMG